MGYIRHHAILVTTYNQDLAKKAYAKAQGLFEEQVSQLAPPATNGYQSFMIVIFPDGGKEGWDTSEQGDSHRTQFIEWLEAQRYSDHSSSYDWVEVQYGDDNGETCIINDSDAWTRENKGR